MSSIWRISVCAAVLGLVLFVTQASVRPEPAQALVTPAPLIDPALEAQLDAFIKETLDGGARGAPLRVRGALVLNAEAAAGEVPALARGIPICTSVGVVACIGGAGYVGWKIGGAINRWLGISASFMPRYNTTSHLSGAWWSYRTDLGNTIQTAPHAPGFNVRGVTSTGVSVDVGRINCNASRTGPGNLPCSDFYANFKQVLDAQPGSAAYWGQGRRPAATGRVTPSTPLWTTFSLSSTSTSSPIQTNASTGQTHRQSAPEQLRRSSARTTARR